VERLGNLLQVKPNLLHVHALNYVAEHTIKFANRRSNERDGQADYLLLLKLNRGNRNVCLILLFLGH